MTLTATSGTALNELLIEPVLPFVDRVACEIDSLPQNRRELLTTVADYVISQIESGNPVKLIFICTHNSRRSHLGQVWCQVAAAYYRVPNVESYSGGTEATACNVRTVRSLRRAGLSVVDTTGGDNPVYLMQYSEEHSPLRVFSKVYWADENPKSQFAAMMCCSDVDGRCPVVNGADVRIPLHYEDPKSSDGTDREANCYDERSLEIAREMFFVMSLVSRRLQKA